MHVFFHFSKSQNIDKASRTSSNHDWYQHQDRAYMNNTNSNQQQTNRNKDNKENSRRKSTNEGKNGKI